MSRRSISNILVLLALTAGLLSACGAQPATPPVVLQPAEPGSTAMATEVAGPTEPAFTGTPAEVPQTPLPSSTPTTTPPHTPTPPATPAPEEILPLILAAFQAQQGLAWRYNSDIQMANGEAHTTVFEFSPPDRYRIVSDGASEVVGVSGKVYLKQGETWTESAVPASSIVDPGFSNRLEQTISDLRFAGFETLSGMPMLVFEYTSTYKIGVNDASSQTRLWIGEDDNLIHRIVIDGAVAALDHRNGTAINTPAVTTITYEYDPSIQIDVPVLP